MHYLSIVDNIDLKNIWPKSLPCPLNHLQNVLYTDMIYLSDNNRSNGTRVFQNSNPEVGYVYIDKVISWTHR